MFRTGVPYSIIFSSGFAESNDPAAQDDILEKSPVRGIENTGVPTVRGWSTLPTPSR
jgi:hypothetical protein